MLYTFAREPACCICINILVTLSSVCVCVCPSQYLSFCQPYSRTNETKQSRKDLRYHPQAGCRSLSLCSFTCWSSYNYNSHPHPSQYCCGVRWAYSFSGSAVLHKETITKSKQAQSTRGGGGATDREKGVVRRKHKIITVEHRLFVFHPAGKSVMTSDTQKVRVKSCTSLL